MTVDDIRNLSPAQMHRIAEIRTEIEALELELEQIIAGEKPRRPAKPKKKVARKGSAKKPAAAEVPTNLRPASPLTALMLPRRPPLADLDPEMNSVDLLSSQVD